MEVILLEVQLQRESIRHRTDFALWKVSLKGSPFESTHCEMLFQVAYGRVVRVCPSQS